MHSGKNQRGFTLLMSALVASIVLALAASIFALAQKELTLSSIGRDSQYAFYAADTAAECALYWDSRFERFPTSTVSAVNLSCDGQSITTQASAGLNKVTSSFTFVANNYCADVLVEKTTNPGTGLVTTVVHADGYSVGAVSADQCSNAISQSRRALQRSVELHY